MKSRLLKEIEDEVISVRSDGDGDASVLECGGDKASNPLMLELNHESLQKALVYTEVFGLPRAKRRRRWR